MSRPDEIVVSTPTQSIYDQLMQLLASRGYTWSAGPPLASLDNYHTYGPSTCVHIDIGSKGVTYCDREYFLRERYDILAYGEYLKLPYEKDNYNTTTCDIQEFIDRYRPKSPVIHIKSQAEYNKLMALLHPLGWNWHNNSINHYDDRDIGGMCINIALPKLKYASFGYYKKLNNSYVIIDFEIFKSFFRPNLNKRVIEVLNACVK